MSTPIALVTGATSGIGAATAIALVDAGYDVIGTGRRTSGLMAPRGVRLVDLDVLDDGAVTSVVDDLVTSHGRLDLLVNNAGSGTLGAVEELSVAEAQRGDRLGGRGGVLGSARRGDRADRPRRGRGGCRGGEVGRCGVRGGRAPTERQHAD